MYICIYTKTLKEVYQELKGNVEGPLEKIQIL